MQDKITALRERMEQQLSQAEETKNSVLPNAPK